MLVLVAHSDDRLFERERFGQAWEAAGGSLDELSFVSPTTYPRVFTEAERFQGLLLTGGPDVTPTRYGAAPHPTTRPDPAREAMDWQLLTVAQERGWPVLGICYGCQLLNVFFGGTLIQHLPEAGKQGHQVSEPKDFLAHQVSLESSQLLSGLPRQFQVNSRHHQGVDRIGAGLRVVAWAPDGVVEAFEATSDTFVLGIQWHPENLLFDPHLEMFRQFRRACQGW